MIEINLLKQLVAFKQCGTLLAASEYVHLSQPSLTRNMQQLEWLLGAKLFERKKNHISLTKTGELACKWAKKILDDEEEMEKVVKAFSLKESTLNVLSEAPGPLMKFLPSLQKEFPERMLSSKIETRENIIKALKNYSATIGIVCHPIDDEDFTCKKYIDEMLYLNVNTFHPAATLKSVTFKEADGQNFIMYEDVGIWDEIVRRKMPHAKFFLQSELETVGELVANSNLPSFASSITIEEIPKRNMEGRVNIPFSDSEAKQTFYIASLKNVFPLS